MGGMTSLYIGVSGLKASQNALNVTAHNLTNVNTTGYVRQTAVLNSSNYTTIAQGTNNKLQTGLGVDVDSISRIRDYFLDKSYRKEVGRQSFYEEQSSAVEEIESVLGELDGVSFSDSLDDLNESIQEMAKDPSDLVTRSELVMNAETFIDRAKSIYSELVNYQKNLDTKVQNTVDRINELGNTIRTLNVQISSVESAGVESANDLRDQRDNALDELAGLAKIQYQEDENSVVTVKLEGVQFVTESGVNEMGTAQLNGEDGSNYLTAVWPNLNQQTVYNLTEDISTADNTDIGALKGTLLARGGYAAHYTDIEDEEKYNTEVKSSVIMKTQALFDKLVNGIVTTINDILAPPKVTKINGADVTVLDTENCSYGTDGSFGTELFSRYNTERYNQVTASDGTVYYVYNETNSMGNKSLYTIDNIEINQEVLEDYSKLPFTTAEGEVDKTRGEALASAWSEPFANLDPDNLTEKNFTDFYDEMILDIGTSGQLYSSMATNQASVASDLNDSRQQVTGVSSDDELANMIKYQNAYNASSRFISVVSDMLEQMITQLGDR